MYYLFIHQLIISVKIPQNCDMVSPLPQPIKDQLRKEKTQCLKEQQIPTKVIIFLFLLQKSTFMASYFWKISSKSCLYQKKNWWHIFTRKIDIFFLIFQVSKSLNTQNGQCTNLKHSVVRQPGKICISMKPVTQCAIGCLPETPQPLNKRIPFTCFNEDRLGEHYAIKVYEILFCLFVKLISRKNNNKHEKAYQYFYNF